MPRNTFSPWTDERVEQLKEMHAAGESASKIADALGGGLTRNAVIGRIHRMGLYRPTHHHPKGEKRIPRKPREPLKKRINLHCLDMSCAPNLPQEIVSRPLTLFDLKSHHCRWPVSGDGVATLFCGADKHAEFPYCARHCRMAYRKARPMSQAESEIHRRVAIRNFKKREAA